MAVTGLTLAYFKLFLSSNSTSMLNSHELIPKLCSIPPVTWGHRVEGCLPVRHCAKPLVYMISVTGNGPITDEGGKAQTNCVTCPKSHSWSQIEVCLISRSSLFSRSTLGLFSNQTCSSPGETKQFKKSEFTLTFPFLSPFTPLPYRPHTPILNQLLFCLVHYSSMVPNSSFPSTIALAQRSAPK